MAENSQIQLVCKRCSGSVRIPTDNSDRVYRCPKCSGIMIPAAGVETAQQHETTRLKDASAELPEEVRQAIREKRNIVGKYIMLDRVGGGGGGEVYKAFDLALERIVALKLIAANSDVDLQRTRSEALVCAHMNHPGIPKIHEFGNDGKLNFMAMEFIDGKNLYESTLDMQTAIKSCCDVANILDYAHKQSVIHRDVKPSNIILGRNGQVYLTDFGIAKMTADSAHVATRSGELKGTPQFMSPEQASCKPSEIDRRTDIFSLGSTLYYLLTGVMPFDGRNIVDLISQINVHEPVPPHLFANSIPREISAIVTKAMEKDKRRRYQSAAEMADDIGRFLRGELVAAKPPSTMRKVVSGVIRWKYALIGAAALLVLALAAGIQVLKERQTTEAAQKSATSSGEIADTEKDRNRKIIDAYLDELSGAHKRALDLRRNGTDYRKLRQTADDTLETYKKLEALGITDAAVHHSLGKLYRLIDRRSDARKQQELALSKDDKFLPALYELGVLSYLEYRERFEKPNAGKTEDASDLKLQAEKYSGLASDSQSAISYAAAGIVRLLHRDYMEASASFKRVLQIEPTFDDAALFLAEIYFSDSKFAEARDVLSDAIKLDCGNITLLAKRAKFCQIEGLDGYSNGRDPSNLYTQALEDWTKVLALDDTNSLAMLWRGALHANTGLYLADHGKDPAQEFQAGLSDLSANPQNYDVRVNRGMLYNSIGQFKASFGEDPTADYEKGIKDFDEAAKISPQAPDAWNWRAHVWNNWGLYVKDCGADPTEKYSNAIRDNSKAISLDSKSYCAWSSRGVARMNFAVYLDQIGKDSTDQYAESVKDLTRSIELKSDNYEAWLNRGITNVNWGIRQFMDGNDSSKLMAAAKSDYDRALQLNPASFECWSCRASWWMNIAREHAETGADPESDYVNAEKDFSKALELNPNSGDALQSCGRMWLNWGDYKMNNGKVASFELENSRKCFERYTQVCPNAYEAWMELGTVWNALGVCRMNAHQDPTDCFKTSAEKYQRALELNSNNFDPWMWRGQLWAHWGAYHVTIKKDPAAEFKNALEDFKKAIELNPADPDVLDKRSAVWLNWGIYKKQSQQNSLDEFQNAERDLKTSLEINPQNSNAWLFRGNVQRAIAQCFVQKKEYSTAADHFESAVKFWKEAINVNPSLEEQLAENIDLAQRAIGALRQQKVPSDY